MIKRSVPEWLFGLFTGGWWHWCRENDSRFLFSQTVISTARAPHTPPPWRRGPDDWDQYLIIRVETNAPYVYPVFRVTTAGLRKSVRIGKPIRVSRTPQSVLLRFGIGKEPCAFGVAVPRAGDARCKVTLEIEYRVIRQPNGDLIYLDLQGKPLEIDLPEPHVHV